MSESLKPSEYVISEGFETFKEFVELSGWATRTLQDLYKKDLERFKVIVDGTLVKKRRLENTRIGKIIQVTLLEGLNEHLYSDKQDTSSIGFVFDEDETHIWIKPFKRDVKGIAFIGSPVRYIKEIATITPLDLENY